MGLLDTILQANGGDAVGELSNRFGLGQDQTRSALEQLVPALAGGVKRNAQQSGGLESLVAALQKGDHDRYLEQPELIQRDETVDDGNRILGHLFGSKDVSRQVAGRASEKTGIDSGILKKMLPLVAAMAMGGMKKQGKSEGGALGGLLGGLLGGGDRAPEPREREQGGSLLTSFLDQDGDGSIADDLFGMAKKFF